MPNLFVLDKQTFFNSQAVADKSLVGINALAKEKNFLFLTQHRETIQYELSGLQAVLKQNNTSHQTSWLYCYYTALLLKQYYDAYSPTCKDAIKYSELCDTLKKQLENESVMLSKKETLLDTIALDLSELTLIPFSVDKLRSWNGKLNMQRLSTRFSMITAQQTLLLARQFHYLDQLENMMGRQVNIAIFDAPIGVYNALSVGIFGFRFLLNLSMIVKHTFIPEQGEASTQISMGARFYEEIKNRHYQMTNDLVWGIVNGLTNYAKYFHIAAPVANYLMIGFTGFDLLWLGYLLYLTDHSFESKRKEYLEYRDALDPDSLDYALNYALENEKLDKLALAHEKARAEIVFYIVAASILVSSFATVFLLAPPVFVPLCFLICNIAIAMYLSGAQYGEYKEKCLVVKQQQEKGLDVSTEAKKDVQTAWDNLGFAIAKNTIAPLVILGAFAFSFPAAICLTLAYMAYECGYLTRLPELFTGGKKEPESTTLRV